MFSSKFLKIIPFALVLAGQAALPAFSLDKPVVVIHGGAGVETGMSKSEQDKYHAGLSEALLAAYALWKKGAAAVDVVEAAVVKMEDNPLFNAGKGAVFTRAGKNELDAAIMDGKTREAGSVAGVTVVKNPIREAIAVMRHSKHVMLTGEGANEFAREQKLEIVDPRYFWTQHQWDALQQKLKAEKKSLFPAGVAHKYGTVGAVVLDQQGNLAAGTSTGGLTGKRWGRVGDSPVIGAGTFADNQSCAVSCTGEGEWFIRFNVASDLASRVKYAHQPLSKAADAIIHGVLSPEHGEGGLIALDKKGNFAMPFNSPGMFRGYIGADGKPHTFVY
ncbi:MAG: isoaspartyl peptidase/L-asparaginase [Candidatus Obscuribacterales bacterium]|nr:isoaspartyl peptidase/L-asparaginase [Candidatus Obscuribacterales bacterium]